MGNEKTGAKVSAMHIVGFACYQCFVFAAFYMGTNHSFQFGPISFERAELMLTLLFMVCAFIGLRKAPQTARAALSRSGTLAAFACFMAAGAAVSAMPGTTAPEVFAESLLIGAPMALTLVAWGEALGKGEPKTAAIEIFAATGAAAGAAMVLYLLPEAATCAIRCLLPFFGIVLLELDRRSAGGDVQASLASTVSKDKPLPARMMAGTLAFGAAAGFVEAYRSDPGSASAPLLPLSLFFLLLYCLAVLEFLKPAPSGKPSSFATSYRIAIVLMLAGFLFAPVLQQTEVSGDAIVLAGYLGLSAAMATLFCAAAKIGRSDCALAFSLGFAVLYGGEALGIALANILEAAAPQQTTPYAALATAGLVVVFAFVFLFTDHDFHKLSNQVDAPQNTEAVHQAIVASASLSSREAEVLALALKGRTNERIAQELFIAKSTADTHLRRIYSKCGVHSRQELLDMAESIARGISNESV